MQPLHLQPLPPGQALATRFLRRQ